MQRVAGKPGFDQCQLVALVNRAVLLCLYYRLTVYNSILLCDVSCCVSQCKREVSQIGQYGTGPAALAASIISWVWGAASGRAASARHVLTLSATNSY